MEPAGHGITAAAKLSTGVEGGEYNLDGGHFLDRVLIDRNTTTVIGDADPTVGQDHHINQIAVAGKRLIHRVIDDFIDQVVKTAGAGGPDIHTGPLTHCLKAFKDLNVAGAVGTLVGIFLRRIAHCLRSPSVRFVIQKIGFFGISRTAPSLPRGPCKTADLGPVGRELFLHHQLGVSNRKYRAGRALGPSAGHVSMRGHPVL